MGIKIRICTCLALLCALCSAPAAHAGFFDWMLFWRKPPALKAPHVQPDGRTVSPPGESSYFPVREDGQPYLLNVDQTVNMTSSLNQFYYDPRWRGEVWVPFDQVSTIEKGTRLMSTWKEYDEFSTLRVFNGFHKFFEKYSGFGP